MAAASASAAQASSRPRALRQLRAVHRWLGLGVALVLLLSAVTGVWLALAGPADKRLVAAPCTGAASVGSVQALADAVVARLGPVTSLTLRLPHGERACAIGFVRTADWQGEVFLHPATAEVVALRAEGQGLHNLVFELHTQLLLGDRGKAMLALVGAAFLALWLTGLALWWPMQWRTALQVRLGGRALPALADAHRVAGVVLGLVVLTAVASGTYVAWRPIAGWVNTLAATPRPAPPALPRGGPDSLPAAAPGPSLDRVVQAGSPAAGAAARLVDIGVPVGQTGPVRLRYHLAGDPHPNGQTYVWVDPRQATVLRRQTWAEADLGARLQGWLYPFHAGQLWGLPHTALLLVAGACLGWFALSGPLLWALRRRTRGAARAALSPTG